MKTRRLLAQKAPASICPGRRRLGRGLYAPELLESRIAPATFIVNSLLDDGDGAKTTLREAIVEANGAPGADTIVFDKALPVGTIILNTVTGEIPISDSLTIKGPGIDKLTITGSDTIRIFNINDPLGLAVTTISGLTLIDGKSASNGGAIYSAESLTLKNVVVASSYATNTGGGVAVNTLGKVSIIGCRIVNNEAAGIDGGGGLYLAAEGGISVVKTTIANNTAPEAGGLYAWVPASSTAPIVLDSLIVTGNSATAGDGGGISLSGSAVVKSLIKNSVITGNTATDQGGGLYFDDGTLVIKKTIFSGNTAAVGGAINDNGAISLEISDSRFLANKATDAAAGGGGALYLEGASIVQIAKTLFSGNSSASVGGAISTSFDTVVLDIKGSSFAGNTAAVDGGAIFLTDHAFLTLKGSVLSGNFAGGDGGAIGAVVGSSVNVKGSKFTENKALGEGGAIFTDGLGADAVAVTLAGNIFSANVAKAGGAVRTTGDGAVAMKGDKVLGNVSTALGAGGLYLDSKTSITLTGLLVQGNQSALDGGGIIIDEDATLTGCKILGNVANFLAGGGGGGIAVYGGDVVISKSIISGNVAATGGGIYDLSNTTIPGTKVFGNSARTDPNTSGI